MARAKPKTLEVLLANVLGDPSRVEAVIAKINQRYLHDEQRVNVNFIAELEELIRKEQSLRTLLAAIPPSTTPGTIATLAYFFDLMHGQTLEARSRANSDVKQKVAKNNATELRKLYATLTAIAQEHPTLLDPAIQTLDSYALGFDDAEFLTALPAVRNLLTTVADSTFDPAHRTALFTQVYDTAVKTLSTEQYTTNWQILANLATVTALRADARALSFTTYTMTHCVPPDQFTEVRFAYAAFALSAAGWMADALPLDSEVAADSARMLYDQLCLAYAQSLAVDSREDKPFVNALSRFLFTRDKKQSPLVRDPLLIDSLATLLKDQNKQHAPMFVKGGDGIDREHQGSFPDYDIFFEEFAKSYAPLTPPVRAHIRELFSSYFPGEFSRRFSLVSRAVMVLPNSEQESTAAFLAALDRRFDKAKRKDVRDFAYVANFGELDELLTPSFISAASRLQHEPHDDVRWLLRQMEQFTGEPPIYGNDKFAKVSEHRRQTLYDELVADARPLAITFSYLAADVTLPYCPMDKLPHYLVALLALPQGISPTTLPPYNKNPSTLQKLLERKPESIDQRIAVFERARRLSQIASVIPAFGKSLVSLPDSEQLPTAITLMDQAQVVYAKLAAKGIPVETIAEEVELLTGSLSTTPGRDELARGLAVERILAPYREGRCTLIERASPLGICATALTGTDVDITTGDPLDLQTFTYSALVRVVQAQAHAITLPAEVDVFPTWKQNAELLSMLATIGTGMIKYDSLHLDPAKLSALAEQTSYTKQIPGAKTDLRAYLEAFSQPELAKLLFSTLEYIRVGTLMGNHYAGAQRQLANVHRAVATLRNIAELSPPDALVERLTAAAFAEGDPAELAPLFAPLSALRNGTATVEDSLALLTQTYEWTAAYLAAQGYAEAAKSIAMSPRIMVQKGSVQFVLDPVQIIVPKTGAAEYLEFDFERGAFSRRVKVHERAARATSNTVVADTCARDAVTIAELRQAYRTLHPTGIRFERRLSSGELDPDAYLEYCNDRVAGLPGDPRFFSRKIILDRRRATLIAADLGASVNKFVGEQRIADAIQRTVVYFAETLHDDPNEFLGIYGYNSNGPDQVVAHVVKEPTGSYTDDVRQRIGNMTGNYGNRDGAIIRHLTQKLRMLPADGGKRLIVLTDGLPEDTGYRDRYAIEDTKRARIQAQELGIRPFAFVLNPQPIGVLEEIWGANNFFQLPDLTQVPAQAAKLYLHIFAK